MGPLDSLRQSVYAGILPDPAGQPPKQDRERAGYLLDVMRRDPPGVWASNRLLQSQQYVGTQYVAIKATWSWLAGSAVIVEREREAPQFKGRVHRKAHQPGGLGNDDRYHPVGSDDELARLFEHINAVDTFQDFIAQLVIQIALTGNAHVWLPRNANGKPMEMWVLPSVLLQQKPGPLTAEYPFGGWWLNPNYGLTWGNMGIPAFGNVPLDRREVLHYREPHAWMRWEGYGATQAMARQIDVLNSVETTRVATLANGINPSGVLTVDGITPQGAEELSKTINKKLGGADNAGKVWVTDGEGGKWAPFNGSARELDMPAGWEQSGRAVLAGYRIPPVVAGIIEANYAEFWGAVRAWFAGELQPFATRFSATLTKHVARTCYGPDYRVRLQLPKIDDPDMMIQQHSFTPNDLYTLNEHRAALDLEPLEGGDVVPSQYAAKANAAMGLGPDGKPMQQPGAEPGSEGGDEDMSQHPLNAVGDEILKALGVAGGDEPGMVGGDPGDPFGDDDPDDDVDSDPDTDVFPKAFGANRFEEGKHKRDHGKFVRTQGAAGAQAAEYQRLRGAGHSHDEALRGASEIGGPAPTRGQRGPALPGRPDLPASVARTGVARRPLPPAAANHPAVLGALKSLAQNAAGIAQRVNAAMVTAGIGPDQLLGDQSNWERWFLTQHADAVASATGLDVQTAAAVLSHLIARGVGLVKQHLASGKQEGPQQTQQQPQKPQLARPGVTGDTGGSVQRPDNLHGAGSLPNRVKAVMDGVPELDAFLESLV